MSDEIEANHEGGAESEEENIVARIMGKAPAEQDKPEPDEADDETTETDEANEDTSEADDEADAADEPEEVAAEPETYTVKIDGKETKVTRDELLSGYQRDADYRRKTQALADQRRQLEETQTALARRLAEIGAQAEPEPDWPALAKSLDPWEYNEKRATWERVQVQRRQAAQEAQQLSQQQLTERARECIRQLPELIPEWRDEKRMRTEYEALMRDVPSAYGIPSEHVAQLVDPAAIKLLRDAMSYHKLRSEQSKAAEKRKPAAKASLSAGSPVSKRAQEASNTRDLRKQLRTAKNPAQERDAFVRLITGA